MSLQDASTITHYDEPKNANNNTLNGASNGVPTVAAASAAVKEAVKQDSHTNHVNKVANIDVGTPTPLGNGLHVYNISGTQFVVPQHFNIFKACGYGAYGFVVAATDTTTNEQVAIKKCTNVFADLADGKRILREIKLLTFLSHENLLSIKDIIPPQSKQFSDVYLVTNLMSTDLNNVIRSKQRLTDEHYQYFMYQLLRGLKYIHSARVLHRDLKPANLLINMNCDLRICDFGLARAYDPECENQDMTDYVITRWYRPPELLLMSKQYSPVVDIWSAGCILAEMANRKPLFPGRDYLQQINFICRDIGVPANDDLRSFLSNEPALKYVYTLPKSEPKSIAELAPGLSPEAQDMLSKMLVFNPQQRATSEELLRHPYLSQLHDPNDEPTAPHAFRWEYDAHDFTETELRDAFWREMCSIHVELEKDHSSDAVDLPV